MAASSVAKPTIPAAALARPLPPRPLLVGELLLAGAQQLPRVGDQRLRAGGGVHATTASRRGRRRSDDRMKSSRSPSGLRRRDRGAPRVNFWVRALACGNDSVAAACPVGDAGTGEEAVSGTGRRYRPWVVSPFVTTTPDGPPPADEPGTAGRPASPEDAVLQAAESVLERTEPEAEAQMRSLDSDRRLLLVHAHPDDETIGNGATMAQYVAAGAQVTLVTCTLGEEGEVLVPELAHLAADQDDQLGQHRIGELATAMEALGVRDHRFLGGPGRYRDSGMMGLPTNDRPGRVLAGRPRRGGGDARRGRPGGAPAGARDLRRERRLRAPGPHPGPPGGDARGGAGGRPGLRARRRASRGRSRRSTGTRSRSPGCARACGGCATPATTRSSTVPTRTATCRWGRRTTR